MAAPPPAGLFASLQRLLGTGLEIVQVRLELLGTELEQQKLRIYDGVLLAVVGLVLLGLALIMFVGFVLLLFQEGYRLPALGVMLLLFAAAGAWLLHRGRERLRSRGGAFAVSVAELQRDREGLGPPRP
jgi:uncharacterized membrane protein YqjE